MDDKTPKCSEPEIFRKFEWSFLWISIEVHFKKITLFDKYFAQLLNVKDTKYYDNDDVEKKKKNNFSSDCRKTKSPLTLQDQPFWLGAEWETWTLGEGHCGMVTWIFYCYILLENCLINELKTSTKIQAF